MSYESAALADSLVDAAAQLSQAAAGIHLVDEPYTALTGVNLVGRSCVWRGLFTPVLFPALPR
jgi:hypothetical protein